MSARRSVRPYRSGATCALDVSFFQRRGHLLSRAFALFRCRPIKRGVAPVRFPCANRCVRRLNFKLWGCQLSYTSVNGAAAPDVVALAGRRVEPVFTNLPTGCSMLLGVGSSSYGECECRHDLQEEYNTTAFDRVLESAYDPSDMWVIGRMRVRANEIGFDGCYKTTYSGLGVVILVMPKH